MENSTFGSGPPLEVEKYKVFFGPFFEHFLKKVYFHNYPKMIHLPWYGFVKIVSVYGAKGQSGKVDNLTFLTLP